MFFQRCLGFQEELCERLMQNEGDESPVFKCRSPLVLWKTYENCWGGGLLPTPKVKPLRKAVYVHHPVIELERAIILARREREFTLAYESPKCDYSPGINLKYLMGIYGEKIARVSFADGEEALKSNLQDDYSPRTREIYDMLQKVVLKCAQDACFAAGTRTRRTRKESGRAGRTDASFSRASASTTT